MPWPGFSDDFGGECWRLSDGAFRLHTEAICWNGAKLYDCRIPKDELPRFARNVDRDVQELLDCGWWADGGDVYVIVHHAQYQRTRKKVLAKSTTNRSNGAKGGRPAKSASTPSSDTTETQSVSESQTQSVSESQSETEPNWKEGRKDVFKGDQLPNVGRKQIVEPPPGRLDGQESDLPLLEDLFAVAKSQQEQHNLDVDVDRDEESGDVAQSTLDDVRVAAGREAAPAPLNTWRRSGRPITNMRRSA